MRTQLARAAGFFLGGATLLGTGIELLGHVRWLGWIFVVAGVVALAIGVLWLPVYLGMTSFIRLLAPALAREIESQGLLARAVREIPLPAGPSATEIAAMAARELAARVPTGDRPDPEEQMRQRRLAANDAMTTLERHERNIVAFAKHFIAFNESWTGRWDEGREVLGGWPLYQTAVRATEQAFEAIGRVGTPLDPTGYRPRTPAETHDSTSSWRSTKTPSETRNKGPLKFRPTLLLHRSPAAFAQRQALKSGREGSVRALSTSKKDASKASKLLSNPKTPKNVKSVAGSDLSQAKKKK